MRAPLHYGARLLKIKWGKKMKLYMAVSADKYELPVVVADSLSELGSKFGISAKDVDNRIWTGAVSRKDKVRFLRVEVSDDEDD